jgi:hypothetical protein
MKQMDSIASSRLRIEPLCIDSYNGHVFQRIPAHNSRCLPAAGTQNLIEAATRRVWNEDRETILSFLLF